MEKKCYFRPDERFSYGSVDTLYGSTFYNHDLFQREHESSQRLDLVLDCFHTALQKKEDQKERYLAELRNPDWPSSGGFTNII
jgi:hypothetical protein